MRVWTTLGLGLLTAACATPAPAPAPAPDFRPVELRQPALFVRVTADAQFAERERAGLPADYEGALLEALNQRAVLVRDVRVVTTLPAPAAAAARARAVGADHAVLVDVQVERGLQIFCRGTRRAFRAPATVWNQAVEVYRASDGARRFTLPPVAVADFAEDCQDPQQSRRRSADETIAEAVSRLLTRLLGA